ncbi:MAG: hypothetical protein D3910_12675 [Candidatus Electrothrix sp. ATG2]|nr:hypothetical protein [Candidatus Electrothrix sp. ATG2]
MENTNKRRFSRFTIPWVARLDFGLIEYKGSVEDVSCSGLYVEGCFDQSHGDVCVIDLKDSTTGRYSIITAICSICRISDDGIALKFVSMKFDNLFFLQTRLLSKAAYPSIVMKEFSMKKHFFKFDGDFVFFESFKWNQSDIKQLLSLPR